MIDAPEINNILEKNKSYLINCGSNKIFARKLAECFVDFDCKIVLLKKSELPGDEYALSGYYRPENDIVTIAFHVNSRNCLVGFEEQEWTDFKFLFSQTLQHELIHRFQYASREGLYDPVQEEIDHRYFDTVSIEDEILYMKDTDEIDAYAHDIAMEILFHYKKESPLSVLRRIDKTRKVWSYNYYKGIFKKHSSREWPVIKKRLLKKTFTWLPYTTIYR